MLDPHWRLTSHWRMATRARKRGARAPSFSMSCSEAGSISQSGSRSYMLLGMCTSAPDSADSASGTNCARARRGCRAAVRAMRAACAGPARGRGLCRGLYSTWAGRRQTSGRGATAHSLSFLSWSKSSQCGFGKRQRGASAARGRTLPSWYTLPPLSMSSLDTSGNSARTASCAGRPRRVVPPLPWVQRPALTGAVACAVVESPCMSRACRSGARACICAQPRHTLAHGADNSPSAQTRFVSAQTRLPSAVSTDTAGTAEPANGTHLQRRALEAVQRVDVRLVLQQPLADLVRALARRQVQRRALVIVAALLVGDLPHARGRGCRCAAAERPCLQPRRLPRPERLSRAARPGL